MGLFEAARLVGYPMSLPLSPSEKIAHGGNRTRGSLPLTPWPEERQPTELPPAGTATGAAVTATPLKCQWGMNTFVCKNKQKTTLV